MDRAAAVCTAFEAYCKVYTADLNPDRIIEFLLLNPEFPHSVRYSVDGLHGRWMRFTARAESGAERS